MRRTATVFLAALVLAPSVTFLASAARGGEEAPSAREAAKSRVLKGTSVEWQRLRRSHGLLEAGYVDALIAIGSSAKRDEDDRVRAIVGLGAFPTRAAVEFCLKNMSLDLREIDTRMSIDRMKMRPCRFALSEMGWSALPDLFDWASEEDRTMQDARDVVWILRRVMKPKMARGILAGWREGCDRKSAGIVPRVLEMLKTS